MTNTSGAAARLAGRKPHNNAVEVASRGGQHGNQYAKVSKEKTLAVPRSQRPLLPKGLIRPVSAIGKRYVLECGSNIKLSA
jgi:hypothetical protein